MSSAACTSGGLDRERGPAGRASHQASHRERSSSRITAAFSGARANFHRSARLRRSISWPKSTSLSASRRVASVAISSVVRARRGGPKRVARVSLARSASLKSLAEGVSSRTSASAGGAACRRRTARRRSRIQAVTRNSSTAVIGAALENVIPSKRVSDQGSGPRFGRGGTITRAEAEARINAHLASPPASRTARPASGAARPRST